MGKIYIVGSVASGKTTMARELSSRLGIPWHELDCIVHVQTDAGRYKRTPEEQVREIERIDREGDWIIEGTPRASCRCLFELADRIVFLDAPLWKRRLWILLRFVKQRLGVEPCHDKSDFHMLRMMYKWTRDFERGRPGFTAMLGGYPEKLIVIRAFRRGRFSDFMDMGRAPQV